METQNAERELHRRQFERVLVVEFLIVLPVIEQEFFSVLQFQPEQQLVLQQFELPELKQQLIDRIVLEQRVIRGIGLICVFRLLR